MDKVILLQLFFAHIITDFVIQPTSWVHHKRKFKVRSVYLYIHSAIAGVTTVFALQKLELWYIGVFIAIIHFLIDWWKLTQQNDNLKTFLIDQFMHICTLLIAWVFIERSFNEIIPWVINMLADSKVLAICIGYILVIFPTGFVIGKATAQWQKEITDGPEHKSLKNAGRFIGIFERILVLTFILSNNFSAIGYLIAAKSILRFSDKGESGARRQTEYVLIGTLMSFAITIAVGLLIHIFVF